MCDFRKPPKQVRNLETGEFFDVKYHGFIGLHYSKASDPGIYMIGATGVGYRYFDGKIFHSAYGNYPGVDKYKMVFDESEPGRNCFGSGDIKVLNYEF